MMNHKHLPWVLVNCLVAMCLVLSACGGGKAEVAPPTLRVLAGSVQTGTGGNWAAATDNNPISAEAAVKTDADSRGVLTFTDGSTVELEPNTEVALTKGQGINLTLASGKVWAASYQNPIRIDAGGPVASSQNAGFSVTRTGTDVSVSATGNTVQFSAGGSEVKIPSGQMSQSAAGGAPSAPAAVEVKNALRIVLTGEALVYLADPQGRAVGYHPTKGIAINQVPESFYVGKDGRPQVITVPDIAEGEYTILLVAANNQSAWKIGIGFAGQNLDYQVSETSSSITWGTPTGITMKVKMDTNGTPTAEISPIWTLYVEPPGKVALADQLKRTKITFGTVVPGWAKIP